MNLPIDIISGTNPPKFRWRYTVDTMNGIVVQDCEGPLPLSVEKAVQLLIEVAKQALTENAALREQLSKRVEVAPKKGK